MFWGCSSDVPAVSYRGISRQSSLNRIWTCWDKSACRLRQGDCFVGTRYETAGTSLLHPQNITSPSLVPKYIITRPTNEAVTLSQAAGTFVPACSSRSEFGYRPTGIYWNLVNISKNVRPDVTRITLRLDFLAPSVYFGARASSISRDSHDVFTFSMINNLTLEHSHFTYYINKTPCRLASQKQSATILSPVPTLVQKQGKAPQIIYYSKR